MYVTFEYYTSTFGGADIPEASFAKYERQARVKIDEFTFDRLQVDNTLVTERVKDCMCEMMELNLKLDTKENETDGKIIASESVDGHSVSYAISDTEKNEVDKSQLNKVRYYNIAREHLSNTGLLYRGI